MRIDYTCVYDAEGEQRAARFALRPARLAKIDENLQRSDLTPAERAAHIAERKRIYEPCRGV